ncbi:hypothetical protein KKC45_00520 [Patescibacteria group bacterium]|nr:hypothetical protein [Patescibacteria group bacterium]
MTQLWISTNGSVTERKEVKDIKVRVIKQHRLKIPGFLEKTKNLEFDVIIKREGGYDVNLAPLGHPEEWGFMYDDEVEEINPTE